METNNKIRAALEQVKEIARTIYSTSETGSPHEDLAEKIVEIANAALAEPVRNYEVGTAEDQVKRRRERIPDLKKLEYGEYLYKNRYYIYCGGYDRIIGCTRWYARLDKGDFTTLAEGDTLSEVVYHLSHLESDKKLRKPEKIGEKK